MIIYIGADHRGFGLKEYLSGILRQSGFTVVDFGNDHYDENDDFVDFARAVAEKVNIDYEGSRGILICGSGVGVDVVANRYPNVRSALVGNTDQAFDSRNDDNANILCLGANYLESAVAKKILEIWLQTSFSEEVRYKRRINKIAEVSANLIGFLEAESRKLEEGEEEEKIDNPLSW
ncbi:MAG: RpiB/LacA/LacB family sugar-phosphate isomerase [Patescibacteria group bacterium]|nr:RpiB/LacA/LacB family sugar-phosphate isomerase [Patescibacteria group bacterium]